MPDDRKVFSVTQVNMMARGVLEEILVWVEGEVDDYEDRYSHAVYFKLKDGQSVLPCMFWKSEEVDHTPVNGEKVLVHGNLTVYEKTAKYQMRVARIEPFGEGELLKKREELRKKLAKEGYFLEEIKRPIPEHPVKIGLITSKRGAAITDFLTNVVKGFEGLEIYFVDSLVQGDAAVKSICNAFNLLAKRKLDLVVLTRGGGDMEDLMCFNSEEVVKAIRNCPWPVISAVGHEIDYTLSDLAADLRVSTPTKAAESISASYSSFRKDMDSTYDTLTTRYNRKILDVIYELDTYESTLKRVWRGFKNMPEELKTLRERLKSGILRNFDSLNLTVLAIFEKMRVLSPDSTLKRGFSITFNEQGRVVRSVVGIESGDSLRVRISDGDIKTKVVES